MMRVFRGEATLAVMVFQFLIRCFDISRFLIGQYGLGYIWAWPVKELDFSSLSG